MTLKLALIAIVTAFLMSVGQLLFKLGANNIKAETLSSYLYQICMSPSLILACIIYALTILIWIWVLNQVPLSRVYPFTALAYILTPVLAYFVFNEKINGQFIAGSAFLLVGIIVCTTAEASHYADH